MSRDLAHEQFQHYRMETFANAKALGAFCQVTRLNYTQEQLGPFVASGAINRHRKTSDSTDPRTIYRSWPKWKQDIVSVMIPESVFGAI